MNTLSLDVRKDRAGNRVCGFRYIMMKMVSGRKLHCGRFELTCGAKSLAGKAKGVGETT